MTEPFTQKSDKNLIKMIILKQIMNLTFKKTQ